MDYRKTEQRVRQQYDESYSKGYRSSDDFAVTTEDHERRGRLLRSLSSSFGNEISALEIGCGTGSTAMVHAPHVAHIRATDISSSMLRIAREKTEAAGISNITYEHSSIEELEVAVHVRELRPAVAGREHTRLPSQSVHFDPGVLGEHDVRRAQRVALGLELRVLPL